MLMSLRPWKVSRETRTSSFLFFSNVEMTTLSPGSFGASIDLLCSDEFLEFGHHLIRPTQGLLLGRCQRQPQFAFQERSGIHPRLPPVYHIRPRHCNALPLAVNSTPVDLLVL